MPSPLVLPRPAALLLTIAAALAAASPAAAAPRIWVLDGNHVRSVPAAGAELAGEDAAPPASADPVRTASAARATPKDDADSKAKAKKKAKKKPIYDLATIRKAINKAGGSAELRYGARAALTTVDRVMAGAPKGSQAKNELSYVLKNTTVMARGNRITEARLPMLTQTLTRNAQWWKQGKATSSSQRVQFTGSQLLWQYYPGSGMQLQWLGTFGRGNMLYYSGAAHVGELAQLVDESLALAVPRAGGIAWEYFFPFGGGTPPWASGMAQATGIQVLARAAVKLGRPELLAKAKSALPLLRTAPPTGVQSVDETGTFYLIYSYAPGQKVLNAMTQTLNGLYAYVLAAPDDVDARLMLLDGLRWLDANVSRYDTGKWTLYQLGGPEANAHYHGVARDFLKTLCALLKTDATTPGGGPSGAFPSTKICDAAATWTKYSSR